MLAWLNMLKVRMTLSMFSEDIEAICLDCGQKFAGGCVQYRSLDAYDDNPEAYCPECDGINLEFPRPRDG